MEDLLPPLSTGLIVFTFKTCIKRMHGDVMCVRACVPSCFDTGTAVFRLSFVNWNSSIFLRPLLISYFLSMPGSTEWWPCFRVKVKGKIFHVYAVKSYRRDRGIVRLILSLGVKWGWVVDLTLCPLYPWERTPMPTISGGWVGSRACLELLWDLHLSLSCCMH
jgi:hypothetical protein